MHQVLVQDDEVGELSLFQAPFFFFFEVRPRCPGGHTPDGLFPAESIFWLETFCRPAFRIFTCYGCVEGFDRTDILYREVCSKWNPPVLLQQPLVSVGAFHPLAAESLTCPVHV